MSYFILLLFDFFSNKSSTRILGKTEKKEAKELVVNADAGQKNYK